MRPSGLHGHQQPLTGHLARNFSLGIDLACDRRLPPASIMGFAPSRDLKDNLG